MLAAFHGDCLTFGHVNWVVNNVSIGWSITCGFPSGRFGRFFDLLNELKLVIPNANEVGDF